MKLSKFLVKVFVSIMFIVTLSMLGTALPQKVKAATLPVQLYYSQRVTDDDYGIGHVEGYIAVQNLAYDKKVTVHYSLDGGKTWADTAASYLRTNPSDNYEVWKFKTPSSSEDFQGPIKYCIKYEVNGQTYWDNNNGSNYTDGAFGQSYVYTHELNTGVSSGEKYLSFYVATKNLTNNINNSTYVKVRYTEDNWNTYKETVINSPVGSYSSAEASQWLADIKVSSSAKQVQFAVLYEVNGTEYWDNNFGSNYVVNY